MPVAAFPSDGIYPNEPLVLDINKDGPVGHDGRIRIKDSILQVNEISFQFCCWNDVLKFLQDALKHQRVRLVVGQKARDQWPPRRRTIHNTQI